MTSVGDHGINKDNQVRKSGNNVSGSYQYGDRKKNKKNRRIQLSLVIQYQNQGTDRSPTTVS